MSTVTSRSIAKLTLIAKGYKPSKKRMQRALKEEPPETAVASRISAQIKAEIQAKFGFVPPFFEPAESSPQVLENLWQQTLSAYVNNPLPALFKEKLSAYLSRFCNVPYCMVCHSCTLRPLGLKAREVLALLDAAPPTEADIDRCLAILAAQPQPLKDWSKLNPILEESLLYCSIFIAVEYDRAERCRNELYRFLEPEQYQHLAVFIAYVKMCHAWMDAHPEVAYEADQRVKDNLNDLLVEEPDLLDFFRNYQAKVRLEKQNRAAQLFELAERKRREEELQQQVERERLVAKIAQRIRCSLNLEEILSTTVAEVRQFLQADRVFIYRFEPDWSGIVAVESVAPGCLSIRETRTRDSFFVGAAGRELYRQGQIYAVEDVYSAGLSQCHLDVLVRLQIRANLVVPIVQGEQLWGLLVANHCLEPRAWQPLELNLLKHLGTQLAIAIQQSELYQQVQTELDERKRSEEKIRQQAALLDITSDAIFVLSLDNQILFWNKGAEQLYGWPLAEAIAMNADELLDPNAPHTQKLPDNITETGNWQGELYHITKDGKEILVDSRWTLMLEAGQPQSILVVNTDITQKKQLERQLLHIQRLESLGTLASGIAHDLNNILTPILSVSQLLQLKLPDANETVRHLLKLQETNVRRGAALVKQVLSFARKTEGKRAVLQVKHVISELKQVINETFPKLVKLQATTEAHLWTVSADATQLYQVLLNLCVNARDAMPDGGTLSISAENVMVDQDFAQTIPEAQAGPYIVITVSDTGTGIPPAIIEQIFEPFFTTKDLGKGTGLGLSTVVAIIKNHGGFIDVRSEVGQGTQFAVYLPAVQTSETQQPKDLRLFEGHGELILVVDDEVAICEMNKALLEAYNYRVLTAHNGIEAATLYMQYRDKISLVLMDMMMPDVDGLGAIRKLQALNPSINVITVSGLISADQTNETVDMGIKASLSKPYTTQELLKKVHSVLTDQAGH